jgi:nucleotide-binding universal stress UspA family protein
MDIRSVLVAVDPHSSSHASVQYAVELCKRFEATLVGIAAEELNLPLAGMDASGVAIDFYNLERTEIEKRLRAAEAHFRASVPSEVRSEWRARIASPSHAVVDAARTADLIIAGHGAAQHADPRRSVSLGQLVVGAGRPVLAVADGATAFRMETAVIAWKDTREARRAVTDALPLLRIATRIVALTVSEGESRAERESLDDLLVWLSRHGLSASSELLTDRGEMAAVLKETAVERGADVVIAGGYGHSRIREWLFGGMTRNLIAATSLNRLFSN